MASLFRKSLRAQVEVRGYKLQRLPLEGYLNAAEKLQTLPGGLLAAVFPGATLSDIIGELKDLDSQRLVDLAGRAMVTAPAYGIKAVAELTGIPEEQLLSDQQIGLDGLAEIVEVWWTLNGLGNFMEAIRRMGPQVTRSIGSQT